MIKLDQCEVEPKEPEQGRSLTAGPFELTSDEEWCNEQFYELLVQKCDGPALTIVRSQDTKGKALGVHRVVPNSPGGRGPGANEEVGYQGKGVLLRPEGSGRQRRGNGY